MFLLVLFSFLGGVVTILSPCILPILPIVLSGSVGGGKKKPFGIVAGFILSFTFFTLFLSAIVRATGLSADALRFVSVVIIFLFGVTLLLPQFQLLMEKLFSKLSSRLVISGNGKDSRQGFGGGILIGLSIGLIWTPCVGPILASIITLAATSTVGFGAVIITLAYALGTAIPMLAIMYGGRNLLQKVPWLIPNADKIQKGFGVLMIITAIGLNFNIDRDFQSYVLRTFPQYGVGLTAFEDNDFVKNELEKLKSGDEKSDQIPNDLGDQKLKAPEIIPGGEWFNSKPLKISDLKDKVVLVDFWTYTCINCQRTFPYLKMWNEKYSDKGLVIIGVHSPEFEFEKSSENLQEAINDFELKYPIVQDNNFETWRAYNNRYWPAKYLIDKDGYIRYTHFGEGAYAETEKVIQALLEESGQKVNEKINDVSISQPNTNITPETYLGSERMEYYYPNGRLTKGQKALTISKNIANNSFSLGGEWSISEEYSASIGNSVLEFNFTAEKVFLVLHLKKSGQVGTVKVYLDGKLVNDKNGGMDVVDGIVKVDKNTLYNLIDLKGDPENHILRLEFSPGIEAYAFTFG